MLKVRGAAFVAAALSLTSAIAIAQTAPLTAHWAYPVAPPATGVPAPAASNPEAPLHIPGATASFTAREVRNIFKVADWRPDTHPTMPAVVASGRRPDVMACGYCHLPSGDGRPENAALAGLPRDYFIAQMHAFRSGARHSSVGGRVPTDLMSRTARAISDAEIEAAADYFASLKHRSFVKVVEVAQVPRTQTAAWLYSRDPSGGSEPLGARIIEMPSDFERFEHRDPSIDYVAYVPPGSVQRGAALVRSGGKSGLACAACHGVGLHGADGVPPIAGRSPTYIVRQLTDFRSGARGGDGAAAMQPVVAGMSDAEMIAVAAYLGSLKP